MESNEHELDAEKLDSLNDEFGQTGGFKKGKTMFHGFLCRLKDGTTEFQKLDVPIELKFSKTKKKKK